MASSYALPSSALPHAHHHHMHSHSHSPPALSKLRTMPNGGLHSHSQSQNSGSGHNHSHDHAHDHDHDHSHDHGHEHNHEHNHDSHNQTSYRANSGQAFQPREQPLPPSFAQWNGWKSESTPGGRQLITPITDSFPQGAYQPPVNTSKDLHHAHRHDHCDHDHDHHDHGHTHDHAHHEQKPKPSLFTRIILRYTSGFPLIHTILMEKDSRRIFYFMTLNFSFMAVQGFYGYVTDSLGLLSDTIHMFFDCVALFVGLCAAVTSKWPSSQRFPYGFGKIETLSGFANGILLMLLSVEIIFEAFERLWEGHETKRLGELFIVSLIGGLINCAGLMGFGHHHGHDHGHGHSHDHSHSHETHDHSHGHGEKETKPHESHGHGHDHHNENMHGIFLHVLADTLGSASVVVSTAATWATGWSVWDPLASCLIAILIFISSIPLIKSSAKRLLLSIPDDTEYNLRNTLAGILQQRGVVGYSVPKFWMDDRGSDSRTKLQGMMHVVAARGASIDEVRDNVRDYLFNNDMDIVVQVEREGDNSCWCGVGRSSSISPLSARAY